MNYHTAMLQKIAMPTNYLKYNIKINILKHMMNTPILIDFVRHMRKNFSTPFYLTQNGLLK